MFGGTVGVLGDCRVGPVGGSTGCVGGNAGPVGGSTGCVGGNAGAVGGSTGCVGGNAGAVGGSTGCVGGSAGPVGGSTGPLGELELPGIPFVPKPFPKRGGRLFVIAELACAS